MADLFKGALYVGAACVLGQAIMKDKILAEKNVRNIAFGGLAGALLGDKLEELITREFSPEEKKRLYGALAGMGLGGLAGYKIADGALDSLKDKISGYAGKKKEAPADNYSGQK